MQVEQPVEGIGHRTVWRCLNQSEARSCPKICWKRIKWRFFTMISTNMQLITRCDSKDSELPQRILELGQSYQRAAPLILIALDIACLTLKPLPFSAFALTEPNIPLIEIGDSLGLPGSNDAREFPELRCERIVPCMG